MPYDNNKDVIAIKEWMAKEPYLPRDFADEDIKKYLHSCYYSLERTKTCFDKFCSMRTQMSEVYTSRDPMASNIQVSLSALLLANYKYGDEELLIHKYDDPTLESFIFQDMLKATTMQADYWVKFSPFVSDGHYVILDLTNYSLKMIPRLSILALRDFLTFLLEGMPVRLKKIIGINAPPYYDTLYALVKPILPPDICEMVYFFPDHQSLYQFIDKKYLPSEYGGEAESLYESGKKWKKRMEEERKFFLNDKLWKADLKKKSKNNGAETMNGSFRTLSID